IVTLPLLGSGVAELVSRKPVPQNPLPCRLGVSDATLVGTSEGYTRAWSNGGCPPIEPAILPRNEVGSFSGSPGPVVAVWTSTLRGDIEKVSVVPTATAFVLGKKSKTSTPPLPLLPTSTLSPVT